MWQVHSEGNAEILFANTKKHERGVGLCRLLASTCATVAQKLSGNSLCACAPTFTFTPQPSPVFVRVQ